MVDQGGRNLHGIDGADVEELEAVGNDGEVTAFRIHMQVTFILD